MWAQFASGQMGTQYGRLKNAICQIRILCLVSGVSRNDYWRVVKSETQVSLLSSFSCNPQTYAAELEKTVTQGSRRCDHSTFWISCPASWNVWTTNTCVCLPFVRYQQLRRSIHILLLGRELSRVRRECLSGEGSLLRQLWGTQRRFCCVLGKLARKVPQLGCAHKLV